MHARNRTWPLGQSPEERCRQRILPIEGGDGSTLTLDFTTGVLDPRLTFTRSTTGTYIGSDGLVKTMAAAPTNDPTKARFDHDPTTLAPRGLLIEGAANNLLFWSESFATSGAGSNWGYSGNTGATVTTDNPAGGMTAFQFAETANGGPLLQSATVTNVVHTFSAWFKGSIYNSVTTTQVQFGLYTTAFLAGTASIISGPGSTSVAGNIVTLSGLSTTQWTRVQFTTSAAIPAGSAAILIYPQTTAFEVNRSFYIWGAQLEAGSGASSYIPTGASQGSRAADECSMTLTNFSSWFNATEGAFLAHARRMRTTDVGRIASANDNTANESIDIGASTTGQFIVTDGGSALATITPGTVTANTAFKIAGAFKLNDVQAALGGTLGTADTGVTMPTVNQLMIGRQAGASPVYLNGTVSLLKFWPTRLPDSQLQSLTT